MGIHFTLNRCCWTCCRDEGPEVKSNPCGGGLRGSRGADLLSLSATFCYAGIAEVLQSGLRPARFVPGTFSLIPCDTEVNLTRMALT